MASNIFEVAKAIFFKGKKKTSGGDQTPGPANPLEGAKIVSKPSPEDISALASEAEAENAEVAGAAASGRQRRAQRQGGISSVGRRVQENVEGARDAERIEDQRVAQERESNTLTAVRALRYGDTVDREPVIPGQRALPEVLERSSYVPLVHIVDPPRASEVETSEPEAPGARVPANKLLHDTVLNGNGVISIAHLGKVPGASLGRSKKSEAKQAKAAEHVADYKARFEHSPEEAEAVKAVAAFRDDPKRLKDELAAAKANLNAVRLETRLPGAKRPGEGPALSPKSPAARKKEAEAKIRVEAAQSAVDALNQRDKPDDKALSQASEVADKAGTPSSKQVKKAHLAYLSRNNLDSPDSLIWHGFVVGDGRPVAVETHPDPDRPHAVSTPPYMSVHLEEVPSSDPTVEPALRLVSHVTSVNNHRPVMPVGDQRIGKMPLSSNQMMVGGREGASDEFVIRRTSGGFVATSPSREGGGLPVYKSSVFSTPMGAVRDVMNRVAAFEPRHVLTNMYQERSGDDGRLNRAPDERERMIGGPAELDDPYSVLELPKKLPPGLEDVHRRARKYIGLYEPLKVEAHSLRAYAQPGTPHLGMPYHLFSNGLSDQERRQVMASIRKAYPDAPPGLPDKNDWLEGEVTRKSGTGAHLSQVIGNEISKLEAKKADTLIEDQTLAKDRSNTVASLLGLKGNVQDQKKTKNELKDALEKARFKKRGKSDRRTKAEIVLDGLIFGPVLPDGWQKKIQNPKDSNYNSIKYNANIIEEAELEGGTKAWIITYDEVHPTRTLGFSGGTARRGITTYVVALGSNGKVFYHAPVLGRRAGLKFSHTTEDGVPVYHHPEGVEPSILGGSAITQIGDHIPLNLAGYAPGAALHNAKVALGDTGLAGVHRVEAKAVSAMPKVVPHGSPWVPEAITPLPGSILGKLKATAGEIAEILNTHGTIPSGRIEMLSAIAPVDEDNIKLAMTSLVAAGLGVADAPKYVQVGQPVVISNISKVLQPGGHRPGQISPSKGIELATSHEDFEKITLLTKVKEGKSIFIQSIKWVDDGVSPGYEVWLAIPDTRKYVAYLGDKHVALDRGDTTDSFTLKRAFHPVGGLSAGGSLEERRQRRQRALIQAAGNAISFVLSDMARSQVYISTQDDFTVTIGNHVLTERQKVALSVRGSLDDQIPHVVTAPGAVLPLGIFGHSTHTDLGYLRRLGEYEPAAAGPVEDQSPLPSWLVEMMSPWERQAPFINASDYRGIPTQKVEGRSLFNPEVLTSAINSAVDGGGLFAASWARSPLFVQTEGAPFLSRAAEALLWTADGKVRPFGPDRATPFKGGNLTWHAVLTAGPVAIRALWRKAKPNLLAVAQAQEISLPGKQVVSLSERVAAELENAKQTLEALWARIKVAGPEEKGDLLIQASVIRDTSQWLSVVGQDGRFGLSFNDRQELDELDAKAQTLKSRLGANEIGRADYKDEMRKIDQRRKDIFNKPRTVVGTEKWARDKIAEIDSIYDELGRSISEQGLSSIPESRRTLLWNSVRRLVLEATGFLSSDTLAAHATRVFMANVWSVKADRERIAKLITSDPTFGGDVYIDAWNISLRAYLDYATKELPADSLINRMAAASALSKPGEDRLVAYNFRLVGFLAEAVASHRVRDAHRVAGKLASGTDDLEDVSTEDLRRLIGDISSVDKNLTLIARKILSNVKSPTLKALKDQLKDAKTALSFANENGVAAEIKVQEEKIAGLNVEIAKEREALVDANLKSIPLTIAPLFTRDFDDGKIKLTYTGEGLEKATRADMIQWGRQILRPKDGAGEYESDLDKNIAETTEVVGLSGALEEDARARSDESTAKLFVMPNILALPPRVGVEIPDVSRPGKTVVERWDAHDVIIRVIEDVVTDAKFSAPQFVLKADSATGSISPVLTRSKFKVRVAAEATEQYERMFKELAAKGEVLDPNYSSLMKVKVARAYEEPNIYQKMAAQAIRQAATSYEKIAREETDLENREDLKILDSDSDEEKARKIELRAKIEEDLADRWGDVRQTTDAIKTNKVNNFILKTAKEAAYTTVASALKAGLTVSEALALGVNAAAVSYRENLVERAAFGDVRTSVASAQAHEMVPSANVYAHIALKKLEQVLNHFFPNLDPVNGYTQTPFAPTQAAINQHMSTVIASTSEALAGSPAGDLFSQLTNDFYSTQTQPQSENKKNLTKLHAANLEVFRSANPRSELFKFTRDYKEVNPSALIHHIEAEAQKITDLLAGQNLQRLEMENEREDNEPLRVTAARSIDDLFNFEPFIVAGGQWLSILDPNQKPTTISLTEKYVGGAIYGLVFYLPGLPEPDDEAVRVRDMLASQFRSYRRGIFSTGHLWRILSRTAVMNPIKWLIEEYRKRVPAERRPPRNVVAAGFEEAMKKELQVSSDAGASTLEYLIRQATSGRFLAGIEPLFDPSRKLSEDDALRIVYMYSDTLIALGVSKTWDAVQLFAKRLESEDFRGVETGQIRTSADLAVLEKYLKSKYGYTPSKEMTSKNRKLKINSPQLYGRLLLSDLAAKIQDEINTNVMSLTLDEIKRSNVWLAAEAGFLPDGRPIESADERKKVLDAITAEATAVATRQLNMLTRNQIPLHALTNISLEFSGSTSSPYVKHVIVAMTQRILSFVDAKFPSRGWSRFVVSSRKRGLHLNKQILSARSAEKENISADDRGDRPVQHWDRLIQMVAATGAYSPAETERMAARIRDAQSKYPKLMSGAYGVGNLITYFHDIHELKRLLSSKSEMEPELAGLNKEGLALRRAYIDAMLNGKAELAKDLRQKIHAINSNIRSKMAADHKARRESKINEKKPGLGNERKTKVTKGSGTSEFYPTYLTTKQRRSALLIELYLAGFLDMAA